jgi:hypothetical protein
MVPDREMACYFSGESEEYDQEEDGLAPAKGIILGICVGIGIWLLLSYIVVRAAISGD